MSGPFEAQGRLKPWPPAKNAMPKPVRPGHPPRAREPTPSS